MFTGFITQTGIVELVNSIESGVELMIKISPEFAAQIQVDSSIAIDGRVLTVLDKQDSTDFSLLKFYASCLNKVKNFQPKKIVNLERAVRLGEEIPGTFFYSVPSGQVKLISMEKLSTGGMLFKLSFENNLVNYLSINDQVSLNGVSLLIKDIEAEMLCFEIYPNTLSKTNLGETQVGDLLNIEVDPIIAKIARIFEKINN